MTAHREPPFPSGPGLCPKCLHVIRVRSAKGSEFLRCGVAKTDPRFAKYPPQPVQACFGYEPVEVEPQPGPIRE